MGSPIAILNIGPTRADDLAQLKINARSGEVCAELFEISYLCLVDAMSLYTWFSAFLTEDVF
jgi:hypothetical protein